MKHFFFVKSAIEGHFVGTIGGPLKLRIILEVSRHIFWTSRILRYLFEQLIFFKIVYF